MTDIFMAGSGIKMFRWELGWLILIEEMRDSLKIENHTLQTLRGDLRI